MTSESTDQPGNLSGRRIFGYILLSVGVLIMLGSGGCSLLFLIGGAGLDGLVLVLILGGIPFLIGLGLLLGGRHLLRKGREPSS